MSLITKIKNRFFWLCRKIRKISSEFYQRFFGIERKYAQTNVLPDSVYLKKLYRARMGKELDLKNPQTFNEKIQWLKLHDRRPEYTTMVDKYLVKQYVADIIGEEYIIPTLGVWDKFDEIDFDSLPNQFVLKCTHDSGGVVICKNKAELNYEELRAFFNERMAKNYYKYCREWPYKNVKRRILAEKYLVTHCDEGIVDYKFFCFNGEPRVLYVSVGLEYHPTAKISFYDLEGRELSFHRSDYQPYHNVLLPNNYSELVRIARLLALKIKCPFLRVDLYSANNRVLFSEFTFSPCGGFLPFDPIEWDKRIGDMINLRCNYSR